MWLDAQLLPNSRYNDLVLTIELPRELDVARFEAAFRAAASRLDQCRLTLDSRRPVQRLSPCAPELERAQLRAEAAETWVHDLSQRGHSFGRPMFTAALASLDDGRHVFFASHHHTVCDGVSMVLLVETLAALYAGGELPQTLPFSQFLEVEAAFNGSEKAVVQREYWERKLSQPPPGLAFYGLTRSSRSHTIARLRRRVGRERLGALEATFARAPFRSLSSTFSRVAGLATTLLAYVYRVTGNRDIVVGLPFANRTRALQRTSGLLMQQVFLRAQVSAEDTFQSLGQRLQKDVVEAFRNGQFCVSDRGLDYVTLNLHPSLPDRFAELPAKVDVRIAATHATSADANEGDLRGTFGLQWLELPDGDVELGFDFHAETFAPELRERAANHFEQLLDALIADVSQRIEAVPIVVEREREGLLRASRGPEPVGEAACVVERFVRRAAVEPERVALIAADATLSYAELESLSRALAQRLQTLGAGRESRVTVCLRRGAQEVLALLATLRAGAAYVPIDPGHPAERNRVILEDARSSLLLTDGSVPALAEAFPAESCVDVRAFLEARPAPTSEPLPAVELDQLAYVLFTSGSTGRPKGVQITRRNFANFLRSMEREPGLAEGDRVLALTTTTFDISGLEIFLPLYVGGTVEVISREIAMDPRLLASILELGELDLVQATPATWRMLIESGWDGTPGLRVLCGGEALSPELAEKLSVRVAELWNVYGPTETTVWSTVERIATPPGKITIGRPIDWTQLYVLNEALELAPEGVVGQLWIGGRGVARGYFDRDELTRERFVPDPFGPEPGRIYATGDLGRCLPDGRFECLGRTDHQVKIRGYRIELGEIESALRTLDGVREVVVLARSSGGGEPWLVAYWVGDNADSGALQDRARERLPPYMVPSRYVHLAAFPLTPNGKIDRKQLPEPSGGEVQSAQRKRPATDRESLVAGIFAEVLGLPQLGVDQDLLELGATSALLVQARARIEQELATELSMRVLFDHPTVERIVASLGQAGEELPIVARLRVGQGKPAPLFGILGVNLYSEIAAQLPAGVTAYGLHVPLRRGPGGRRPSVEVIASSYLDAIKRVAPRGPYHLIGLCFGGLVAFEAARQLEARGDELGVVALLDTWLPRGRHVSVLGAVRHAAEAVANPSWLRQRVAAVFGRVKEKVAATPQAPVLGNAELEVDGAEVQEDVARYDRSLTPIRSGELHVFRAAHTVHPSWIRVEEDLGWGRLGAHVRVHRFEAGHTEIVTGEHARAIAGILGPRLKAHP
jgi:amino acid adenylation domain-containing protein